MNAVEEMTWMMRREMSLRSVQPEGYRAIQRGDGKIVVVMPTGAGKSMLFMLPPFGGRRRRPVYWSIATGDVAADDSTNVLAS